MNILAKEEQKYLNGEISEKEYFDLYFALKAKDENSFFGRMSHKTRKRIHKLVLSIIVIKNHLSGFSYEMISDKHTAVDRPVIYAITHIGKFDIEVISEAIKDHYYLLSGDYEHLQGIMDGTYLLLNGVFYFNEHVKEDRTLVVDRMIEHLKAGGNVLYFPEGAWNMSPNLPMLPCYWGIVDVVRKSGASIIPIAIDQYGKHFKINIGENIDLSEYGESKEEKAKAINYLRDVLATLKWGIWETEHHNRNEIQQTEWDDYISVRLNEWTYSGLEYIERLVFKPKGIYSRDDVFKHLDRIIPSKANAFLFSKRNHD